MVLVFNEQVSYLSLYRACPRLNDGRFFNKLVAKTILHFLESMVRDKKKPHSDFGIKALVPTQIFLSN